MSRSRGDPVRSLERVDMPRAHPPSERGSTTILTAGVMVLACVLSLVAADLSRALAARAGAQTAADAAALAAAQEIARPSGSNPEAAAATYAGLNGAELLACACDPGSDEAIVEVRLSVHLLFLGPDRTVRASARAVIGFGGAHATTPPG